MNGLFLHVLLAGERGQWLVLEKVVVSLIFIYALGPYWAETVPLSSTAACLFTAGVFLIVAQNNWRIAKRT